MRKTTIIAVVSAVAVMVTAAGGVLALRNGSTALADTSGETAADVTGTASGTAAVAPLAQQAGVRTPVSEGLIYANEYRNSLYNPTTGMSLFWQNDAAKDRKSTRLNSSHTR